MMMFRLPSPLPIDWGRLELGPPVGEAAAALGATLLAGAPLGARPSTARVVGAVVAPPVQAPTSRPTAAGQGQIRPLLHCSSSRLLTLPGRHGLRIRR